MKARNILMILIVGISTAVGAYIFLPHLQSSFPIHYVNMEIVGLDDTYKADQIIKFQVKASGYGMPCSLPEIIIYKSYRPSVVVFEKKFTAFMCPLESPMLFSTVYPGKNDTYSLTINDPTKYTIDVSFLNSKIKKEFQVK